MFIIFKLHWSNSFKYIYIRNYIIYDSFIKNIVVSLEYKKYVRITFGFKMTEESWRAIPYLKNWQKRWKERNHRISIWTQMWSTIVTFLLILYLVIDSITSLLIWSSVMSHTVFGLAFYLRVGLYIKTIIEL